MNNGITIDRKVSVGTLMNLGALILACAAAYYSFKESIADAGEMAARAEKLSSANTSQISDLQGIVSQLTSAIAVQNNTLTYSKELQALNTKNIEQRLDDLKERIDRRP